MSMNSSTFSSVLELITKWRCSMLREDIRGICHRPCIYNDKDKCDMWDQLSVPDETEECANQIDV